MASRKLLKKNVKDTVGELFADCVAISLCDQNNREALDALMAEVITLYHEYVSRINHTEPGATKAFYQKFNSEFDSRVSDLRQRIIKA